jgi:hypothetical protein
MQGGEGGGAKCDFVGRGNKGDWGAFAPPPSLYVKKGPASHYRIEHI